MQFSKLIERTPRRVLVAFAFAYSCTVLVGLLPMLKKAQMF